MRRFPKRTPWVLLTLLVGGGIIFLLNGFFPVPVETVFAAAGIVVFLAGMVGCLVAAIWAIRSLASRQGREASGIIAPVSTILIALITWSVVIVMVVVARNCLDHRDGPSPLAPFHKLTAAIGMYEQDCGRLPDSLADLLRPDGAKGWTGPYLEGTVPSDAWGHPIQYAVVTSNLFELRSPGPDEITGTPDDIVLTLQSPAGTGH